MSEPICPNCPHPISWHSDHGCTGDNAQCLCETTAAGLKCLARLDAIGIHPLDDPMGALHHSDAGVGFTVEDERVGDDLAYFLGTIFADIEEAGDRDYLFTKATSCDMWRRVVRALRIHGLKIADDCNSRPA